MHSACVDNGIQFTRGPKNLTDCLLKGMLSCGLKGHQEGNYLKRWEENLLLILIILIIMIIKIMIVIMIFGGQFCTF